MTDRKINSLVERSLRAVDGPRRKNGVPVLVLRVKLGQSLPLAAMPAHFPPPCSTVFIGVIDETGCVEAHATAISWLGKGWASAQAPA